MDKRLVAYLESLGAGPDALDGWEIHTATRAGEDVAFIVTQGAEIHFVTLVDRKAMSRANTRQFLLPLIEKYGYASTRVPISETNHRLRLAVGFEHSWSDENFSYWTLTQAPYEKHKRNTPCQS